MKDFKSGMNYPATGDKVEQIYTLTCDCCRGVFQSPSGFPEIQLCPSCMPDTISGMEVLIKEEKMEDIILQCKDCGWTGKDSECIHTYRGYTVRLSDGPLDFDVEPVLECPKCNSENLWEIGTDKAELEFVPV